MGPHVSHHGPCLACLPTTGSAPDGWHHEITKQISSSKVRGAMGPDLPPLSQACPGPF